MLLEPKSVCDLELGPLENLEAEGVLEPETMFELDLLVLLVLKIVSGLVLVPGMMLESMTMSELERALRAPCSQRMCLRRRQSTKSGC